MGLDLSDSYVQSLVLPTLLVSVLQYRAYTSTTSSTATATPAFKAFQFNYLACYLLATFAVWVQCPWLIIRRHITFICARTP